MFPYGLGIQHFQIQETCTKQSTNVGSRTLHFLPSLLINHPQSTSDPLDGPQPQIYECGWCNHQSECTVVEKSRSYNNKMQNVTRDHLSLQPYFENTYFESLSCEI